MLILIAALDETNVIGNNGSIPWHIKEDFQLFKEFTQNKIVVMGRKTWDSLPKKPLPNRKNIVISRNLFVENQDVEVINDLKKIVDLYKHSNEEVFIIGGSRLYDELIDEADYLYLSHVKGIHEGDTFFPKINLVKWKVIEEKNFEKFIFKKYERINLS